MKVSFISTHAISNATRLSVSKTQAQLIDAQKELSTGRLADVGKTLGHQTGETISLRQEHARLNTIVDTNVLVTTRLEVTQLSLQNLVDTAQAFVGTLIGARTSESGPELLQSEARTNLTAFADVLNTSIDGAYIFSGINSDIRPISEYFQEPAGANKQAVATSFLAAFGVTQDDPAAGLIASADMQSFLDTAYDDLFDDANWSGTWSGAADQGVKSRISTYELIETSVSTNEGAMRKLASAYTMVADLGVTNLSNEAFQTIVDQASVLAAEAIQEFTVLQAKMGSAEERVSNANERMALQADIMANHISILESVDPYEASTRVTELLTQIETSYALTARIQRLSLTNFL